MERNCYHTFLGYEAMSWGHTNDHVSLYLIPGQNRLSRGGVQGAGWADHLQTSWAVIQQLKHPGTHLTLEGGLSQHNLVLKVHLLRELVSRFEHSFYL